MEKENVILFCLLSVFAVCYSLLQRKRLLKIGKKCNISFYKNETKKLSNTISLKDREWNYRGEGNGYLTLSLPETRQILRIKKVPHPVGVRENLIYYFFKNTILGDVIEATAREEEKENLQYYHTVLNLIGESYVKPAREALLDKNEIFKIDNIIESLRPENRKKKHLAYACGSLLADYAYFPTYWVLDNSPTYSVEIKPKQGWISKNERNFPICTFCLNQYIKYSDHQTEEISQYCPMDMFSGHVKRMNYAIRSLLKSPQNNLRIFKNGQIIYGENRGESTRILSEIFKKPIEESLSEFCELIIKALLTNLSTKMDEIIEYSEVDIWPTSLIKNCDFTPSKLPPGCVLDRILRIQKLDQWGSQEIYKKVRNNTVNKELNEYLMAAVAKDLSLMITFQRHQKGCVPNENIIVTDNGIKYAFQIGVFDLYPKNIASVEKHAKKRLLFAKTYIRLVNNKLENFINN